jgi:hypothetical protein
MNNRNLKYTLGTHIPNDKRNTLTQELDEIYSKYGFDGYILPIPIPSKSYYGCFHDEIMLFHPENFVSDIILEK